MSQIKGRVLIKLSYYSLQQRTERIELLLAGGDIIALVFFCKNMGEKGVWNLYLFYCKLDFSMQRMGGGVKNSGVNKICRFAKIFIYTPPHELNPVTTLKNICSFYWIRQYRYKSPALSLKRGALKFVRSKSKKF